MSAETPIRTETPWLADPVSREVLERLLEEEAITEIMLAVPDHLGRLQGKIFNARVFLDRMADGAEMCSYILATDVDMAPLDGFDLTGWNQGYGDFLVRPDLATARLLPHRPGTALVIGTPFDGAVPVPVAPRSMLQTQLDRLGELGYQARVGVEIEFLLYTDTPSGRTPAWRENLDYGLQHPPAVSDFFRHVSDALGDAGIVHEAIKTEGAAGQAEVSFAYGDALRACDDYAVFRHVVRDIAGRHGMIPAFMAAPETGVGSGLHLHLSLWSDDGTAHFAHHPGQPLSTVADQAVAGLLGVLPHMGPLYAPNVNSWKRYGPHSFAPHSYNWGHDHRGCAIRLTGHGDGAHLECRLAGADANVYLALASYVASMGYGIEEELTAPPACNGDAYQDQSAMPLYSDLGEALQHFDASPVAERLLGKDVVRHYSHLARTELLWHRTHVTDTERLRGAR